MMTQLTPSDLQSLENSIYLFSPCMVFSTGYKAAHFLIRPVKPFIAEISQKFLFSFFPAHSGSGVGLSFAVFGTMPKSASFIVSQVFCIFNQGFRVTIHCQQKSIFGYVFRHGQGLLDFQVFMS